MRQQSSRDSSKTVVAYQQHANVKLATETNMIAATLNSSSSSNNNNIIVAS